MEFEVINNKSRVIKKQRTLATCIMTVRDRGFYFSKEARAQFGIEPGKYLHLVRGLNNIKIPNGYWYFVCNEDEAGFKITHGNHETALVWSSAGAQFLMKELKCKLGDSFYLQETKCELDGRPVVEILVAKTVQEILKK